MRIADRFQSALEKQLNFRSVCISVKTGPATQKRDRALGSTVPSFRCGGAPLAPGDIQVRASRPVISSCVSASLAIRVKPVPPKGALVSASISRTLT
jgi:hypothetical protein